MTTELVEPWQGIRGGTSTSNDDSCLLGLESKATKIDGVGLDERNKKDRPLASTGETAWSGRVRGSFDHVTTFAFFWCVLAFGMVRQICLLQRPIPLASPVKIYHTVRVLFRGETVTARAQMATSLYLVNRFSQRHL